ncbi:putative brevis radix (BRX) domain, transcription factor BREVIS RADIX domain-containing protein [Helianthus anomalus]
MLTCIACSKERTDGSLHEQEEDDTAVTPRTNTAIKALTLQIKDIAVKASGAYKNCKPCSGSSNHNRTNGDYADSEAGSGSGRFNCGYQRTCNSTPRVWGKEMEARLKGLSSGGSTPASYSDRIESIKFVEEDEVKEWVAQVEPGVLITFHSLPQGGNDLKRIRFSREMFNKRQAQRWWAENSDKVMELYNVQRCNHQGVPVPAPPKAEDESSKIRSFENSPVTPPLSKEPPPRNFYPKQTSNVSTGPASTPALSSISGAKTETSSLASARSSSSREGDDHSGELSMSNASDVETEWVEQDEPGVYITIRALPGGNRELRRVRFSREKFGETNARVWWEQNRARIQEQYL